MSSEKTQKKLEEAIENAVHVSNDVDLKTAIRQKTLCIVSSDPALYEKMLKKFPKPKVARGTKALGKVATALGVGITALSGGILAPLGVPLAGAGLATGVVGAVLEDYKDYKIFMDYDEHQVVFVKVKGTPRLKI